MVVLVLLVFALSLGCGPLEALPVNVNSADRDEVTSRIKDVSVSDITATSATLRWRASLELKAMDFKVECVGVRHYITTKGTPAKDIDKIVHYVPVRVDHVLLGNLKPNFNYSCIVVEDDPAGILLDTLSVPVLFSTHYGVPETPLAPTIIEANRNATSGAEDEDDRQEGRHLFDIHFFPTSSKNGPIIGYEIRFRVTEDIKEESSLLKDYMQNPGTIYTLKDAEKASQPMSFMLFYASVSLPEILVIDDTLLQNALKSRTSYSVTTVAVTKSNAHGKDSTDLLLSSSNPSPTFTIPALPQGNSVTMSFRTKYGKRSAGILGGLLPLVLILSCLGAYISHKKFQTFQRRRKELLKTQQRTKVIEMEMFPGSGLPEMAQDAGPSGLEKYTSEELLQILASYGLSMDTDYQKMLPPPDLTEKIAHTTPPCSM